MSTVTQAPLPSAVELESVPFFPQEAYQCGPAALATTLNSSGVEVSPPDLTADVYLPGKRGSFQAELIAATRSYDRIPYVLPSDVSALLFEIAARRPVLVFQNVGPRLFPVWHYAVVIGYSSKTDKIVLRSGTTKREVLSATRFVRTWERGGSWAMVALRPGELPAGVDQEMYMAALAAAESSGRCDLAGSSYLAALGRWPDSTIALFGLGNCYHAEGDPRRAEQSYRRLLELNPRHAAALNNLAQVLADQGRCREASETIDAALGAAKTNPALLDTVTDTNAEVLRCRP